MSVTNSDGAHKGAAKRVSLLVLALWLPICMAIFFVLAKVRPIQELVPAEFALQGWLLLPMGLLAALVAYSFDALTNRRISIERRWLWALSFVVAGIFAIPAYWWLHVRRDGAAPGVRSV